MPIWKVNFNLKIDSFGPEVVRLVATAQAHASAIRDIPITPFIQKRIDRLNILRAVHGTTGIEGANLTMEEVDRIITSQKGHVLSSSRAREEQEAKNAWQTMNFITATLSKDEEQPLTEEFVKKIHSLTTQSIAYPNNAPGSCRRHPVYAGGYVPPREHAEISALMEEFFHWLNKGEGAKLDPVVRAIAAHFYFISIHPFGDGNGRTARAIESFLLYKAKINARGFYSLSNFYYKNRSEYVRLLDHVRFESNGDLTPLILFALRGLVEELKGLHEEVLSEVRRIAFRDYAREILLQGKKTHSSAGQRMLIFLTALVGFLDGISLSELTRGDHVLYRYYVTSSRMTLSRDLDFLKENKFIQVNGDNLKANIDIMRQFTPTYREKGNNSSD